ETLIPKGETIEGAEEAEVKKGKKLRVAVAPEQALAFPLRSDEKEQFTTSVKLDEVIAPIEKGQPIGKVSVQHEGDEQLEYILSTDEGAAINLVAETDV